MTDLHWLSQQPARIFSLVDKRPPTCTANFGHLKLDCSHLEKLNANL